jgi:hypothetical protein
VRHPSATAPLQERSHANLEAVGGEFAKVRPLLFFSSGFAWIYSRLEPSDAKRLRALESESRKLKKLLEEQMLEHHQVSQRRACDVLQVDRYSVR